MLCSTCTKLAFVSQNKKCVRCQNVVFDQLSVLCDTCSTQYKQCAVCLKKVISDVERNITRGCNCGGGRKY